MDNAFQAPIARALRRQVPVLDGSVERVATVAAPRGHCPRGGFHLRSSVPCDCCVLPSLVRRRCHGLRRARRRRPADRAARAHRRPRLGWDDMRAEAWEKAVKSFQQRDRASIRRSKCRTTAWAAPTWPSRSSSPRSRALERCRELYRAQVGRQFTNRRRRSDTGRIASLEIDEQIRQVQTRHRRPRPQDQLRQLQNARRDIQENITRGNNMTIESSRPGMGVAVARQRVLPIRQA